MRLGWASREMPKGRATAVTSRQLYDFHLLLISV